MQGYEYKYDVPVLDATNNAINRNNQGIMYMEMGNYAAAMTSFKTAIALNPNSPASAAYYNNIGLLYTKLGQYKEAQDCFNAAISINPVFLEYYKNQIDMYAKAGLLNSFLNNSLAQINQNSKNSQAYLYAGLAYAQMKNSSLAKKYLNNFVLLEKNQILSRAIKQYISELDG